MSGLTLVAFQAAAQSEDAKKVIKTVRRVAGALQNHFHANKQKEGAEPSEISISKSSNGSRVEDAMDEVEDFDLITAPHDDGNGHAKSGSSATASEGEGEGEYEGSHAQPGWTNEDLLRAAAAEAKAHASSRSIRRNSGSLGTLSGAALAAEMPPMDLMEQLIASSPALQELHSLLTTALDANPKEGLLAPVVELVIVVLQYCKRRRAEHPETCGQAGALLCRRLLREHMTRVVDACLYGNGPTSPPVQGVLRLIATLAGWSVAVALDLSRLLKWDLLFALANKTTQPGSGKPNYRNNNKGNQKPSDKPLTTAATAAAADESNEDPLQSKASTSAAASSSSSSTGSSRNNGAVSARHLFVSIVCAFLRHDSQRTTLSILAPQGKARAPPHVISNDKKGGPNKKGGKQSSSSQVVVGRYLDRGCALAYALGAAPLAEDDARTLFALLPMLTDVARRCLFAHGDNNSGVEDGEHSGGGQATPQPQRPAGKLRELAALCLLDGYALKRLLGLLTRSELALRTAAADLVALLLQPPNLVPHLNTTDSGSGGAATTAMLIASSATAAAASDPFLRAHRRCLARALPMAVAALVQGGYLHMADSSEPRALLLKLLHRDCGGRGTNDRDGDASSLVVVDRSSGDDDDDDDSDADAPDEESGEQGPEAQTRRQPAAGGGTLVAVAMAALGSAYSHAWDLSDVFKVDLAGTTTVWLQLNAPLPPAAAVAASASINATSSAGGSAPSAAHDSGLLSVVLPPDTGRRELSRALQSPNSTVLRTALMVISATLDRASRLIADSINASSSKSNDDISRSFGRRLALALKARLPEVQVLVALRPKLEAAAQKTGAQSEKEGPTPVLATTGALAPSGDNDDSDGSGDALYTLLLNTMRRYVEVLDQSASSSSMITGGSLGGVRFDALKVLADNANPIASMSTLVRNEALALLLAVDPRRLRWLPSPAQLDAMPPDLATLPLAELLAYLRPSSSVAVRDDDSHNTESRSLAFATATRVLESTGLFAHHAATPDPCARALHTEMAAWLDHSSPVPLVRLLSELAHSATLVVAIHTHANAVGGDVSSLHCSPLLLAALLTVGNASSSLPPSTSSTTSTTNMDIDEPPSSTLHPSLSRLLGGWAAHSGAGWSETVCRVCEATLHATTPEHTLALARVALRFLSQNSIVSSSNASTAASSKKKSRKSSSAIERTVAVVRDKHVIRFMARLQQFLQSDEGSHLEIEHEDVEPLDTASLVALPPLACLSELCHNTTSVNKAGVYPIANMESAGVGRLVECLRTMEPRRLSHALAAFRSQLHFMLVKMTHNQSRNTSVLASPQPLKKKMKANRKAESMETEVAINNSEDVTASPEWAAVTVLLAFVRRLLVLILEQTGPDQMNLVREAAAVLFDSDQIDNLLVLCTGDLSDAPLSASSPSLSQLCELVTSRVLDFASLFYNAYQIQHVKSDDSSFNAWCASNGLSQLAARLLQSSSSATSFLFSGGNSDVLHAMVEAAPLEDGTAAYHMHSKEGALLTHEINLPLLVALSKRVGQGPAALASLWLQDPAPRSSLCPPLLRALDQSLAAGIIASTLGRDKAKELSTPLSSSSSQLTSRPSTTPTVWLREAWTVCGDVKLVKVCWSRLEALVSRLLGEQKQQKKGRSGSGSGAATTDDASCLGVLAHAVRQHRDCRNTVATLVTSCVSKASSQPPNTKISLQAQAMIFVALPLIQRLVMEGDAPPNLACSVLQCVLPILTNPETSPWLHKKLLLAAWRSVPNYSPIESKKIAAATASLDSLSTCFACVETLAKAVAEDWMSRDAHDVLQLIVSSVDNESGKGSEEGESAEMEEDEEDEAADGIEENDEEEEDEDDNEEEEDTNTLTDSQLSALLALRSLLCSSTQDAVDARKHLLPKLLHAVALRDDAVPEQRLAILFLQLYPRKKEASEQPSSDALQASGTRVYKALLDPSSHHASSGEEKAASRLSSSLRLLELLARVCPPQDATLLQSLCKSTPFLALLSNEVASVAENSTTTSPARLLCVACKVLTQSSSSSRDSKGTAHGSSNGGAIEAQAQQEDLAAVQSSGLVQKLMVPYGATCSKSDSERLAALAALRRYLPTLPLAPHDLAPGGSGSTTVAAPATYSSASKSVNETPFEWFFDLFTGHKIAATLEHFPTRRGFFPSLRMSEEEGNRSSEIKESEDQTYLNDDNEDDDEDEDEEDRWEAPLGEGDSSRLYDPAFVLPLLVAALAYARQHVFEPPMPSSSQEGDPNTSNNNAYHRQRAANAARLLQACAECGVLSIAFAALSSARPAVRAAAAACLEHVDVLLNRAFSLEARNRTTTSSSANPSGGSGGGSSADRSSSSSGGGSGSSSTTLTPALTAEAMQGVSLLVRCRLQLAAVVHAARGTMITALEESQDPEEEEYEEAHGPRDVEGGNEDDSESESESSSDHDESGDEIAVTRGVAPQAEESQGQTTTTASSFLVPRLPHMHALFLAKACLYAAALSAPRTSASTSAFFVRSKRHSGYSESLPPPGLSLAIPVLSAVAQLPTGLRNGVPLFETLWSGTGVSDGAARARLWALEFLRDSAVSRADTALLARGHVLPVLMSSLTARAAIDMQLRHAILDLIGKALKIRACARNFVVVSGGLSWLRSLVASCADDFAASGPLADQGLMLHLLELLKLTVRFATSYWLEQVGKDSGVMNASSEEEEEEESKMESDNDGEDDAEEEEVDYEEAGKRSHFTLIWECNQTVLCATSAAAAWLRSHPSGGNEENGGVGGGSAEVALALVEVITSAAAHAQLIAPLDTLLGLAHVLPPLSSSSPPRMPSLNSRESLEALAVLIATTVAHPHSHQGSASVVDQSDEAALAWAVNFTTSPAQKGGSSLPLLAECSKGALRLVALYNQNRPRAFKQTEDAREALPLQTSPLPPAWLLTFAARTVASSSAAAPSQLTKPLIAAAVASATVLASAAHTASTAASASSSVAVTGDSDDAISSAMAAVCARVGLPCDDDADESWVDRVVAALAVKGADATADALGHLGKGAFGPGGWLA